MHMPLELVTVPDPSIPNQRLLKTGVKENTGNLVAELVYWAPLLTPALLKAQCSSRTVLPRPLKVTEDTDGRYMATYDEPTPVDYKTVAKDFADGYLIEWNKSMGRPCSRKQIHLKFASLPQHSGLSAVEVLKTILFDSCDGKQCRQRGCKDYPETIVYKADFVDGLRGRRQTHVMALKVVTLNDAADKS